MNTLKIFTTIDMIISLTYSKENVEENIPIKDRIRQFQSQNQTEDATMSKPAKQRPSSAAFDLFESQGLIISQVGYQCIVSMSF